MFTTLTYAKCMHTGQMVYCWSVKSDQMAIGLFNWSRKHTLLFRKHG